MSFLRAACVRQWKDLQKLNSTRNVYKKNRRISTTVGIFMTRDLEDAGGF